MLRLITLSLLVAAPIEAGLTQPSPKSAPAIKKLIYLDPSSLAPERMLPAPPPAGSPQEGRELADLRQLIATTSPVRMAQAQWDDAHETPIIFDDVTGRKLEALPATWALLLAVQNEADRAADLAKVRFARMRPWGVDGSLPNCDAGKGKQPTRSYPSGHASLGYSVGWTLAELMPERAPAILALAEDYALSRQICGVHFRSDTEASHVLATLVAERLFTDPRLAERITAARAELARP